MQVHNVKRCINLTTYSTYYTQDIYDGTHVYVLILRVLHICNVQVR